MSSKGFTIVEILVASAILVVIISVASGLFVSLVRHQRRVMDKQELLNQTSYIMEYMSRALRMARKDGTGVCLSVSGLNYENPLGDVSAIKFINHSENDACQEFFLDEFEEKLKESKNGNTAFPLTSDKLQINYLKFNVSGQFGTDDFQPRVTISLEVQIRGEGEQPKIQIQTTISQRNLDV